MTPDWNSSGLLGGPERRQADRRARKRGTPDRRRRTRRRVRTAILAAAMSAPAARPAVTLFPPPILQGNVDVTTAFTALPPNEAYEELIQEAAKEYDLDPHLIRAVMQAESAFHPLAVSRAGAQGLMQLMPALAEEMSVADVFDPRENVMGGARYLRQLLDMHRGNLDLALASYNAGPGNVSRYGGVPPFRETRNYLKTVKRLLAAYERSSRSSDAD